MFDRFYIHGACKYNAYFLYPQEYSNKPVASQRLRKSDTYQLTSHPDLHHAFSPLPLIGAASLASLRLCLATAVMSQ